MILTVLKVIGVVLLVLIVLIAVLLFWLTRRPFVPNSYTKTVETGGTVEAKYLAMGPYAVKQGKDEAPEDWKEFVAYYPAELEGSGKNGLPWSLSTARGCMPPSTRPCSGTWPPGASSSWATRPGDLLRGLRQRHPGLAAGGK